MLVWHPGITSVCGVSVAFAFVHPVLPCGIERSEWEARRSPSRLDSVDMPLASL